MISVLMSLTPRRRPRPLTERQALDMIPSRTITLGPDDFIRLAVAALAEHMPREMMEQAAAVWLDGKRGPELRVVFPVAQA